MRSLSLKSLADLLHELRVASSQSAKDLVCEKNDEKDVVRSVETRKLVSFGFSTFKV